MLVDPIDDRPHHPDSEQWIEQWQFDFWSPEHDLGGWIHFAHDPTSKQGWYVAALVGVDRPLVLVVDAELRITDLSPYLEFRAEGIFSAHSPRSSLLTLITHSWAAPMSESGNKNIRKWMPVTLRAREFGAQMSLFPLEK